MAAIDFPNSPTNGQVFTSGGMSWTYQTGVGWTINSAIVDAGSGFTFIQDTMPLPINVGDTWFDNSTGASGGTSWVAIEEGPVGSEKNWVQFAPGQGAGATGAWAIATQVSPAQAIAATAVTTISWAVPTLGDIVYEPPAIGTLAFVLPRRATYNVWFSVQASVGTIDRARITVMGENSYDCGSIGGVGTISVMRTFNAGTKLQFQTYNGGAAGSVVLARVEIREMGSADTGLRL